MTSAGKPPQVYGYNVWHEGKKSEYNKRGRRPVPTSPETQCAIAELQECMTLDDFVRACERNKRRLDRRYGK